MGSLRYLVISTLIGVKALKIGIVTLHITLLTRSLDPLNISFEATNTMQSDAPKRPHTLPAPWIVGSVFWIFGSPVTYSMLGVRKEVNNLNPKP